MNITTKQAAEILGVIQNTVCNLVAAGKLRQTNERTAPKQHIYLNDKEVRAFKKTYVPKGRKVRRPKAPVQIVALEPLIEERNNALDQKIAAIEEKLGTLVNMHEKLWGGK